MSRNSLKLESKVFGGLNFMVVFWTLITMLRLVTILDDNVVESIMNPQLFVYIIPMLFLTILNLLIGISLFFPQKRNNIWALSILIVVISLAALNTFHVKIKTSKSASAYEQESIYDF